MEALLPSEIARLVLGYLEDQKCTEAAKLFLETSPHLQECRTVYSLGRRFSTRVSGLTLMDIIEKFSAISAMIQERLNKVTDCEQLKHCGDLMEQLKFLVEEPRGQRFVVNINVPSQSNTQISNGSPIIASSMRKRRHSNSERIKRTVKSQANTIQPDVTGSPSCCHNVDATPLESLPGNTDLLKQAEPSANTEKKDENITQESHSQCEFDKSNNTHIPCARSNSTRRSLDDVWNTQNFEMDSDGKKKGENNTTNTVSLKCTAATNTEERLSFSSAEVQTTPYDIPESESESNDEPIENLSILTKEILNRTELQECIAENINRAIIPTDLSLRDESLHESMGGEGNTSIMTELNNAIKSIVEATETDPVFEKFLDEIIGPHTETDTSPEEDVEGRPSPKSPNETQEKQAEMSNISSPEPAIAETKTSTENGTADVPLKHRLRSSSRQQSNRIEDEVEKTKNQEKEQNALEDQNAAAVLSIINANIINNTSSDKKLPDDTKESMVTNNDNGQKAEVIITNKNDVSLKLLSSANIQRISNVTSAYNNADSKVKKSMVKRPKPTKLKRDEMINENQPITEHEIMTMPTLIVCSKEEINDLLTINCASTIRSTSTSRFIPIAPKDSNSIAGSVETVYLRTVNVAHKMPKTNTLPAVIEETIPSDLPLSQIPRKITKVNRKLKNVQNTDTPISASVEQQVLDSAESVQTGKIVGSESITLYGNENNAKTLLDGTTMPMINLEENISFSESGLSPYLKFNCSKISQNHNLSDIDLAPMMENAKNMTNNGTVGEQQSSISKNTECDIISKRTPKTLLKNRSKNRKLSLSTPRKRNSHIRALDFSTPTKVISSTRKANENGSAQFSSASAKRLKSVCRTSLFKSPSFSGPSTMSPQKQKNAMKVCQPYKIPIATRSPAPKLMGGWDKYNGVGVIIGDVSPHQSTSASSSSEDRTQYKTSKTPAESWDADLRKSIQLNKKDEIEIKKPLKKKDSTKDKNEVIHKKIKYNSRSVKNKNKRNTCEANKEFNQETEDTNEPEENSQESAKIATTEKDPLVESRNNEKENIVKTVTNADDAATNKPEKTSKSIRETAIKIDNSSNASNCAVAEKKPVKKYVQLKTIRASSLKKSEISENKKSAENMQVKSHVSEFSKILFTDSIHHLRMPDILDLETPRKFDDNTSGVPPTPRLLSPSSNIITPFIKLSEDSSKMRSFISTPEFPKTPSIALTPKLTEETTRDVAKKNDYNSSYYKPISEQIPQDPEEASKNSHDKQESPIIGSSHIKLQAMHNNLTSDNTYQTCTSSKLEITQFEVIKENLPKEEAIKELKIASSSKDSACATELKAPIVTIDHHIDLIQINEEKNEFKDVSERCETINEESYVGESDNSSSSDITSSSNSSSSSTSTTNTTSSTSCSSIEKHDSPAKNTNAHEGTNIATQNNTSANIPIDKCDKLENSLIENEFSPKKVFTIVKTDDQINATFKETPAKDENLLNEADISETPSGSKSGIDNLTNLSTKISAIITKEEKLSKLNKSPKNSDKIISRSRSRSRPRIVDIQHIPKSLKIIEPAKSVRKKCQSEHQSNAYNKLIAQLEEKRQRMIAKFRDIPKSNLSTTHKRILGKASENRKGTQLIKRQKNLRSTTRYPYKMNINKDQNRRATSQDSLPRNSISTRKRCEMQKQNSASKCDDNEEETKKQVAASKNIDTNLMNHGNNSSKPLNSVTKQPQKSTVCNIKDNLVENHNRENEPVQLHKISSSEGQEYSKDKSDIKKNVEKDCIFKDNIVKEKEKEKAGETKEETLRDNNSKISKKETAHTEKHIVQEIVLPDKAKEKICDQTEDKANKIRQISSYTDKSKCILKCKIDQVKRDLFSDEENDQRTLANMTVKDDKAKQITSTKTQNSGLIEIAKSRENANIESPKEELSTVLQCLQLVPAHKNEHVNNDENQTQKKDQEQTEFENINEDVRKLNQVTDTRNYKAEYHFMYDDTAPTRKRRRRYSGHDLQIKINYADLSDPNSVECIKVMKATEFEEIFNMPPKTKKRTLTKKTATKNEKGCETCSSKTENDAFFVKDNTTKPLATSSPIEVENGSKMKKIIMKTATANKTSNDTQSDAKKKMKLDKIQEKVPDIITKSRKRKLSETKEIKQIEKKPCSTDPQTLLSNVDLNEFLSTVHGPE